MRITPDEIRLIAFVLLGLLIGATVSHFRHPDRDATNDRLPRDAAAQRESPRRE